jgi:hypothetical protein
LNNINAGDILEIFFMILVYFFAILGVTDTVKFVVFKFFNNKNTKISNCNEAEFVIRSCAEKQRWQPNNFRMICIEHVCEEETNKILNIASDEFDFIEFNEIKSFPSKDEQC